jgi:ornithine--oxo-acid transaminase
VAPERAAITVMAGNFHGRTTTIVGFSDDPQARAGFGPFTPGFRLVPYADIAALDASLDADSVAVLVEPVQGEAGVVIPPKGYLAAVRRLCDERGVLLIADEIQSGLGRTGRTFACEHEGVVPDVYLLGKALGGAIVPLSAVVADASVLGVLEPGSHGSTFGGNALACAVGDAVLDLLESGEPQAAAATLGARWRPQLERLPGITAVRSVGLWAGIDVDPAYGTGRQVCLDLMARGVLAKDTHGATVRLAPPLVIEPADLDRALEQLAQVLAARAPRP